MLFCAPDKNTRRLAGLLALLFLLYGVCQEVMETHVSNRAMGHPAPGFVGGVAIMAMSVIMVMEVSMVTEVNAVSFRQKSGRDVEPGAVPQ